MKKTLIILLCIILLIHNIVIAPDIDYDNPEDINYLSPEIILNAIFENKITDLSLIKPELLTQVIKINGGSSILTKIENKDLSRALNQDPSLINELSVFKEVDKRARENPSILNDNPLIKKQWFNHYDIIDNGANIEMIKGSLIKTSGDRGTAFNPKEFSGAIVESDGSIIFKTARISGGLISKKPNGDIMLDLGAEADLTNLQNSNDFLYTEVKEGSIKIGDKTIMINNNNNNLRVSINLKNEIKISGSGVIIEKEGLPFIKFSGSYTEYPDGQRQYEKGNYQFFENGKLQRIISTTTTINHFFQTNKCQKNCIEEIDNSIRISIKGNNFVGVSDFNNNVKQLIVDSIEDQSHILYFKNGVGCNFNSEGLSLEGPASKVELRIYDGSELKNQYVEYNFLSYDTIISDNHLNALKDISIEKGIKQINEFITGEKISDLTYAENAINKAKNLVENFFNEYGGDYESRYPEGLSQHRDKAITLEEFVERMNSYKGINPYNAYNHVNPGTYSQREQYRYVIDPVNPDYVIDMEHFFKAGAICALVPEIGNIEEYKQYYYEAVFGKNNGKSGGNPQDYYSNDLGEIFFRDYYLKVITFSNKEMYVELKNFLKNHPE